MSASSGDSHDLESPGRHITGGQHLAFEKISLFQIWNFDHDSFCAQTGPALSALSEAIFPSSSAICSESGSICDHLDIGFELAVSQADRVSVEFFA